MRRDRAVRLENLRFCMSRVETYAFRRFSRESE